jgi:MOB kinase activator 1
MQNWFKSSSRRDNQNDENKLYMRYIQSTLVNGSFSKICVCPKNVDLNEWLAVSVFDFFTLVDLFWVYLKLTFPDLSPRY